MLQVKDKVKSVFTGGLSFIDWAPSLCLTAPRQHPLSSTPHCLRSSLPFHHFTTTIVTPLHLSVIAAPCLSPITMGDGPSPYHPRQLLQGLKLSLSCISTYQSTVDTHFIFTTDELWRGSIRWCHYQRYGNTRSHDDITLLFTPSLLQVKLLQLQRFPPRLTAGVSYKLRSPSTFYFILSCSSVCA